MIFALQHNVKNKTIKDNDEDKRQGRSTNRKHDLKYINTVKMKEELVFNSAFGVSRCL